MSDESHPVQGMKYRLSLVLLIAMVLLAWPAASRAQQAPPDRIDELLASPAPDIPPGLQALGTSSEQAREQRVSRRLDALFRNSPLAAPGSGPAVPMKPSSQPPPIGEPSIPRAPVPAAQSSGPEPLPTSMPGSEPPAATGPGSRPPPFGAPTVPRAPPPVAAPAEPAVAADGLGPEQVGWSVSQGKQITFYGSPSAAACRSDCARRMDCVGYTWVKPGGYTAGDPPVCYLMSEIEALTSHPCCVTATRFDFGEGAGR